MLVKKTVDDDKIDDVARRSFSTNRVRIHVKLFDVPRIRVAAGLYPGTNQVIGAATYVDNRMFTEFAYVLRHVFIIDRG